MTGVGLVRRTRHGASEMFLTAMLWLAGKAPRRLTIAFFAAVGHVGYHLLGRDRKRILARLEVVMPGLTARQRRRFTRRVFVELGKNAADVFRLSQRPAGELVRLVDVVGEDHFAAARAAGRGVVAVTGHLGAWELVPGYFAQRGMEVAVVARHLKYPRLDKRLGELRTRWGVTVVHEGGDLRPALKVLAKGGAVGILIDQDRRSRGVWTPFLGRPARSPFGPVELARRTGAGLVAMGIRRVGGRHRITVLPPVDVDWERPGVEEAVAAGLLRSIESLLWQSPEQWTWMYEPWSSEALEGSSMTADVERGTPTMQTDAEATAVEARRPAANGSRTALRAVTLLLALGFWLGGCGGEESSSGPGARAMPAPAPGHRGPPDQEITQFILRENDEQGRLAWILRSAQARIYEADDEVEAEPVQIDFYDRSGQVSSVLTADRGVIARRTNDMRALGHVVVRNRQGDELQTEELQYSARRQKITTDKFVRIIRGRDVLTGYGLLADPDLAEGHFEIQRDVQATVRDLPEGAVDGGAGRGADGSSTTP